VGDLIRLGAATQVQQFGNSFHGKLTLRVGQSLRPRQLGTRYVIGGRVDESIPAARPLAALSSYLLQSGAPEPTTAGRGCIMQRRLRLL